ncbi:hypothetical protein M3661_21795 [Paenibacillus sp. MER 180]|uniref:Uncharacterized protein n=1 Tax=Paenibacillus popilliae TaxID=78057 RepID=A0ABY3AKJ3_PAEPP|nr:MULTISPECIES: hypothetical protein [unclassified Paenibacillus]MCM3292753.1 hypothetical protein [Paenibacillus sp. MER 180]TQR42774.1 hypothetical protein C7Y44_22410 [Paenibacillus sp. SDF0028]
MVLTLDISNEEFDAIVDGDGELTPTIFLNFPSDIRGIYEFELINTVINIYDFKDQIQNQGLNIEDDSLFVFGKMRVEIEGVKGADFKIIEGNLLEGREQYHSWPYTIDKGDIVCKCGGKLSFLDNCYISLMIVTECKPKITLKFDIAETVPFDFMNSSSIEQAKLKKVDYEQMKFQGKLFDFGFFQEYFGSGRSAIKSE